MKIIEPVLFVDPYWEMIVLRFAWKNNIKDFDVLCNYSYQKRNFELLARYIDPTLIRSVPVGKDITSTIELMEESKLADIFKYFLIEYLKQYSGFNAFSFDDFLNNFKLDYYVRKSNFKLIRDFELSRSYNTIIYWNQPDEIDFQFFNRIYGFIPNLYNKTETWIKASEYVMELGYLDFTRTSPRDFGIMLDVIQNNKYKEIFEYIYQKKKMPKKEFKQARMGL